MNSLQLSLTSGYIPNWSTFELVREVITNALDAHDLGHPMTIVHQDEVLYVSNQGSKLDPHVLLMGSTTKANRQDQRGQFGEGLKAACLVAARSFEAGTGIDLKIYNDGEIWTPRMEASKDFPGKKVLTVHRDEASKTGKLCFEISGITKDLWLDYQNRFLALVPPKISIKTDRTRILLDPERRGAIYVKGILVSNDKALHYGYDFDKIRIDRDRKMADVNDIRSGTAIAWRDAAVSDPTRISSDILPMLESQSQDLLWLNYYLTEEVGLQLVESFKSQYGEKAVPVRNEGQAREAEHFGLHGVVLPDVFAEIMEKYLGNFETAKGKAANEVMQVFDRRELVGEMENWDILMPYMEAATQRRGYPPIEPRVEIVRFRGTNEGQWAPGGQLKISRHILSNMATLTATLAHEIAHDRGRDGSVAHERAETDLLGELVTVILKSGKNPSALSAPTKISTLLNKIDNYIDIF